MFIFYKVVSNVIFVKEIIELLWIYIREFYFWSYVISFILMDYGLIEYVIFWVVRY